jgi:flagellar basal body-associated protein FliL
VWENGIDIIDIVIAAILVLLLAAVVTVVSIMTFKKKPDDRNSGRDKENKKSRNKYHGKNKGARIK